MQITFKLFLLRKKQTGFSLAEVAIAVAIAALGLISLLGLTPSVFDSMRKAGNTTTATRILEQIAAELQSVEWGSNSIQLQSYKNQIRYYDDQGTLLSSPPSGEDAMRVSYLARISLLNDTEIPAFLPGDGEIKKIRKELRIAHVDVSTQGNADYTFPELNSKGVFTDPQDPKIESLITRVLFISKQR